jgi:hypothetical protein
MATTSLNLPAVSEEVLPSPAKGRKWCECGCKGTLDVQSNRHYIRGHRPQARKKIREQAQDRTKMPELLHELRGELQWRELRHRELEKAIGANLQKIRTLREVVEKMESIQGRDAEVSASGAGE